MKKSLNSAKSTSKISSLEVFFRWMTLAFKSSSVGFNISAAFFASLLLALSAKFQIPLYPVKISMQPFTVLFLGAMLGSRLGFAAICLYLLEGVCGLPVFQGTPDRGIGLAYMMGPTGGYLFGFAVSAFLVGKLCERGMGNSIFSAALVFIIGAWTIDLFGVTWLTHLHGFQVAKTAWLSYQVPFILNTLLGALLIPAIKGRVKKKN